MYVRQLFLPKGTRLVGKMHAQENFFLLLSGDMTIWSTEGRKRVGAGFMAVTKPGDKRVGYAHEDSVCLNFHPNPDDETDLILLEQRYIVDEQNLLAQESHDLLEVSK
jgi:quercetin dioxygenase-like cupin family protein